MRSVYLFHLPKKCSVSAYLLNKQAPRQLMSRRWLSKNANEVKLSERITASQSNEVGVNLGQNQLLHNFVTNIIDSDIKSGKNDGKVLTRFPPEPNGYLHLGHAKSVNVNFAMANKYNGACNMRFDDTNPEKEEIEYIESILDDVRWLVTGNTKAEANPWNGEVRYASQYFPTIYKCAEYLIENGLAYVDHLSTEEIRQYRGSLTTPGQNSPYRNRSIEENLQLFRDMKNGKFPDGHCVLRAKIDMSHPNMNLRDPLLYRIRHHNHPMTGNEWCIYPLYDFAHAISDALEGITHSLCTLEFEVHRPLYDWIVDTLLPSGLLPYQKEGWRPHQYEFSRLNMQYIVLSKRKLIQLVQQKYVDGWDDPRMPTIAGMRRRGYPASGIKLFCERIGISKAENNVDMTVLEDCIREVLDTTAPRAFAVPHPLKITITNWTGDDELFTIENHPKNPDLGTRQIPFSKEIYISHDDFFDTGVDKKISPPKGFKRLLPGGQVRLKFGYVITCQEVIRDNTGKAIELKCTYDPLTSHGTTPEGAKKVKGIIQWVSAKEGLPVKLHLYDRLFVTPSPGATQPDGDFLKDLNPDSLHIIDAIVEPSMKICKIGDSFQFERIGYFVKDKNGHFNRIVTLKDTWSTQQQQTK